MAGDERWRRREWTVKIEDGRVQKQLKEMGERDSGRGKSHSSRYRVSRDSREIKGHLTWG